MFVYVHNCDELERRFADATKDFHVKKRKEVIRIGEELLTDVLKSILCDNLSNHLR